MDAEATTLVCTYNVTIGTEEHHCCSCEPDWLGLFGPRCIGISRKVLRVPSPSPQVPKSQDKVETELFTRNKVKITPGTGSHGRSGARARGVHAACAGDDGYEATAAQVSEELQDRFARAEVAPAAMGLRGGVCVDLLCGVAAAAALARPVERR